MKLETLPIVRESSDELNPPVVTMSAGIARTPRSRTLRDYLALAFATWGVGYIPLAPGTFGSAVGVGLYLLIREATLRAYWPVAGYHLPFDWESFRVALMLIVIFGITETGIWAASRTEKLLGRKDPRVVVVDEVAGQLIAFLFIPLGVGISWRVLLAGFLLFRLFDIWKPYPIRRLEALESGLGIMADDVLAGIYAGATLAVLITTINYVNLIS